jgi:hypothetical protein
MIEGHGGFATRLSKQATSRGEWRQQRVKRGPQSLIVHLRQAAHRRQAQSGAAHIFADFGQYSDAEGVNAGTVFSTISVSIELAANLERELKSI